MNCWYVAAWSRELMLPVLMLRRYTTATHAVATLTLAPAARQLLVHGDAADRAWFTAAVPAPAPEAFADRLARYRRGAP